MANISNPKTSPSQVGSGFWARQTRKDKIAIITFAVQLTISVGLVVVGIFNDNPQFTLAGRLAILTGNILALVVTLQFAISRFFDDQEAQIDRVRSEMEDVKKLITRSLEEMESITGLGETYIKIYQQEEGIKNQYQSTLDGFLRRLSNWIDDKRSGALDIMDYYGALENLASSIEQDKQAQEASSVSYNGEIWALSFLLDDEWDDSSIHEVKWFETLKRLDQSGIPTRRLWAFDKKWLALLKKEPIDDEGRELVRRLSLYCADTTAFKNTQSYALPKVAILDEHVRLFGKGHFAVAFSDGKLSLIRGVCFDNLLSQNALGGEIDFDEARIRQIRYQWQRYLALAMPLKAFLHEVASNSVRDFMNTTWTSSTPTTSTTPTAPLPTSTPSTT